MFGLVAHGVGHVPNAGGRRGRVVQPTEVASEAGSVPSLPSLPADVGALDEDDRPASDEDSLYDPQDLVSEGGSAYVPPESVAESVSAGCESSESDDLGSVGAIVNDDDWSVLASEDDI